MIKKVLIFLFACVFVACGTKKTVVTTTKKPPTKTAPVVVKTVPKKVEQPIQTNPTPTAQTETLEATSKVKVTTELVNAYIDKYKSTAMENMRMHGVPASIALAQAILESGAGTGSLSRQSNNHFGIKCHKDWNGPGVKYDDDEAQECFRKYDNVLDSYQDYAAFLKGRRWYDPLFKLEKNDYIGWAKGLKKAGYATDPKYPSKLIGIIERYQLQKYDAEVLGIEYKTPEPIIVKDEVKTVTANSELHEVIKGDTLYSISKRYNISIDELKTKNNISESSISIGQFLKIK